MAFPYHDDWIEAVDIEMLFEVSFACILIRPTRG